MPVILFKAKNNIKIGSFVENKYFKQFSGKLTVAIEESFI